MEYLSFFHLSEETMLFIKEYQMLLSFMFVSFAYLLRSIPMMIIAKIKNMIFVKYEICEVWNQAGSVMYENVSKLIHKERLEFFSRNFEVAKGYTRLGDGIHIFKYRGKYILARMSKLNGANNDSPGLLETDIKGVINLTIPRWNRNTLEQLLDRCNPKDNNTILCEVSTLNSVECYSIDKRLHENRRQYCHPIVYWRLEEIFQRFRDKEYYLNNLKPHKETILLYGVPGTGKTSLCRHFACKYDMDIRVLSAGAALKDISKFNNMLNDRATLILVEDIDRNISYLSKGSQSTAIEDTSKAMSIDELLNRLDGIVQLDNVIVVFTTNNAAKLERALYRVGRVDHLIEMGYVDKEQAFDILGWDKDSQLRQYLEHHPKFIKITAAMLFNISNAKSIDEIDAVLEGNDLSLKLSSIVNEQTASSYHN